MRISLLAVLASLACCAAGAARAQDELAGCPADWQERVAGVYHGEAGQTGPGNRALDPVTTMFTRDASGSLAGAYVDQEPTRTNPGTLALMVFEPCRATFRWHDLYGEGLARFEFAPDGRSFSGNYGVEGQQDFERSTVWNGRRD